MKGQRNPYCQDCGAQVIVEVAWGQLGVAGLYFECEQCGEAGWVDPTPSYGPPDEVHNEWAGGAYRCPDCEEPDGFYGVRASCQHCGYVPEEARA